jgi:hypothetical protein
LNRIIIIELKAPNTPLYGEHFRQLQGYVRHTEKWLKQRDKGTVQVEGLLIGVFASIDSKAEDVDWLISEMEKTGNRGACRVYSIDTLLERAEAVHKGLLDARNESNDSHTTEP